jgi:hypothetical protein
MSNQPLRAALPHRSASALHDVDSCLPYFEIARSDSRTLRRSNASDCPLLALQVISGGKR